MKILEDPLRQKVEKVLDEVIGGRKGELRDLARRRGVLEADLQTLSSRMEKAEERIKEVEEMAVRPQRPIEEYVFESRAFREAVALAEQRAHRDWVYYGEDPSHSLSTLHGIVSPNQPFQCLIEEHFKIVMAGLKTRYETQDRNEKALIEMTVSDRRHRPFIVDADTVQVLFLQPILLDEECIFDIRCLQGTGTLHFNIIGLTISRPHVDPQRPEFSLLEHRAAVTGKTCFLCGAPIHSGNAVKEADRFAQALGLPSGILCCDCFRRTRDHKATQGQGGE